MMSRMLACVPVLAAATFAACAKAQEQKIAVVDMERVLSAHPDTKDAEAELQKKVEEFEKEKKEMTARFEKLKKEFDDARADADNRALSDDGRAQKRKLAEEKVAALREFDEEVRQTTMLRQKQLNDRKRRMRTRIVEDIKAKINDYAARKGFTLVLDSGPIQESFGMVVYSVPSLDITDAIVKMTGGEPGKERPTTLPPEALVPEMKKTPAQPLAPPAARTTVPAPATAQPAATPKPTGGR